MHSIHSNSSGINPALTCYADVLSTVFSSPIQDNTYWIGRWMKINAEELGEWVVNTYRAYPDVTQEAIRRHCIALIIHKINNESYAAGYLYKLYEERKEETLRHLFDKLILTEDEVLLIKNQCDYSED
jgi:hypothetical protein